MKRTITQAAWLLALYAATIAIALMLSGCASDSDRCLEYGFQPATEGWANCRMNLDLHG